MTSSESIVNVMKRFDIGDANCRQRSVDCTHTHSLHFLKHVRDYPNTHMPILSICASIVPSGRPPAIDNSQFASEVKAAHHSRIPTNAVSNTDGRQDPGPAAATTGHASASR